MTEKRFKFIDEEDANTFLERRKLMTGYVEDNTYTGGALSFEEAVVLLNKFQELSVKDLQQIELLRKENIELKEKLDYLQSSIKEINQECKEVFKS